LTAIHRQRDVLRVAGPDARTYLQGQLSQDVDALDVGGAADTFVLQPTGKVEAWMRVSRMADDVFMLDVDAGWGAVVLARLTRFLLRTDCTVASVDWDLVTVLDAEMGSVDVPPGGLALPVIWPGLRAVDLLGPSVDIPEGLTSGDGSMWEHRRVAAGIPMMGAEIDETTIPGATGVVDRSASFTKGCYTGQELVARVDSRSAGTPTRIVRAIGQDPLPSAETEITLDGVAAGRLTSVAARPGTGPDDGFVALAEVKRAIVVPVTVDADGTSVSLLAD
jgi:folate-binding protein YgfZ